MTSKKNRITKYSDRKDQTVKTRKGKKLVALKTYNADVRNVQFRSGGFRGIATIDGEDMSVVLFEPTGEWWQSITND